MARVRAVAYLTLRIATDSIYRAAIGRLVETNKRITAAFVEMSKQQRTGDCDNPAPGPSASSLSLAPDPAGNSVKPMPFLRSQYPHVKFWTKLDWKTYKASQEGSSELKAKTGERGGSRASKGENVMMLYVENADGTIISGTRAAEIRECARSI